MAEMRDLRLGDITREADGTTWVHIENEKDSKAGNVVVLSGYEPGIIAMIEGRNPSVHLFARMPKNMDVQSYRRASAQTRYQRLATGREFPLANVNGSRQRTIMRWWHRRCRSHWDIVGVDEHPSIII